MRVEYRGSIGIMEKNMDSTGILSGLYRGYIGVVQG